MTVVLRRSVVVLLLWLAPAGAEPGGRWDGSALAGAGLPSFRYEVVPTFPGSAFPGAVHTQPYVYGAERRLMISARKGEIYEGSAEPGAGPPTLLVHLREPVAAMLGMDPERIRLQLWSTLFDREFPERNHLYIFFKLVAPGPPRDLVARFEVEAVEEPGGGEPEHPVTLVSGQEVISWESNGHDGGDMAWGPRDGLLYISAGDRSSPGDPNNLGQRVDDIHGSILRIDVHAGHPYAVPPDNPFVGIENVRPEIWSYGLRNPWRMAFHPERGELWVGDNGDENWEMVHKIEKGANAGWSAFEGSHVFRASNRLGGPTLVHSPAIVQQPHSEMRSVIGGFFYRGNAMPELQGHYLYGCYFTKRLWAFSYVDGQVGRPEQIADSLGGVVAITEGHDREPLITCHEGQIYTLKARASIPDARPWPGRLSESGLFSNVAEHQLAAGVSDYLINAAAWSDGADSRRFIALGGGAMKALGGLQLGKSWELPVGSAIGKTLSHGGRRIETQLLYFDGTWRGYTYRWNEDGRDAQLVSEGGEELDLGGQKWRFQSRAECMTCHTHRSNFALALTTRQLDCEGAPGKGQIDRWLELGLLEDNKPLREQLGQPVVDPQDAGAGDLETRARTYLDLNCAHCHRETGLGGRAGFQLLADLSLEQAGIIGVRPTVGLLARPGARIIAPGDPANSELLERMNRRGGAGQMPLLGSQVVDEAGVALIREWIESLPAGKAAEAAGE